MSDVSYSPCPKCLAINSEPSGYTYNYATGVMWLCRRCKDCGYQWWHKDWLSKESQRILK